MHLFASDKCAAIARGGCRGRLSVSFRRDRTETQHLVPSVGLRRSAASFGGPLETPSSYFLILFLFYFWRNSCIDTMWAPFIDLGLALATSYQAVLQSSPLH